MTSFARRTRQTVRKCSHCRSTNHTVNCCDDVSLTAFDTRLLNKRDELREIGVSRENSLFYYKTWLLSIEPGLLKAYAIRYCGANSRIDTVSCVNKITEIIFHSLEDAEEEFIPFLEENENENYDDSFQLITDEEMQFIDADVVERYHIMRGYVREPRTSENRKYALQTSISKAESKENCLICYNDDENNSSMVKLNCGHEFCSSCVQKVLKLCCPTKQPRCALCRMNMTSFEFRDQEAFDKIKSNLVV